MVRLNLTSLISYIYKHLDDHPSLWTGKEVKDVNVLLKKWRETLQVYISPILMTKSLTEHSLVL